MLCWGLRISSDTCWAEAGPGHRMEGGSGKPGECEQSAGVRTDTGRRPESQARAARRSWVSVRAQGRPGPASCHQNGGPEAHHATEGAGEQRSQGPCPPSCRACEGDCDAHQRETKAQRFRQFSWAPARGHLSPGPVEP